MPFPGDERRFALEIFQLFFVTLVGLTCGMLVNYIAEALPVGDVLFRPICWHCTAVQPFRNYFFWPRICQTCGTPRKLRTRVVELACVIFSTWIWYTSSGSLEYWVGLLTLAYLGIVALIDIDHRQVINYMTLCGAALGMLAGSLRFGAVGSIQGGVTGFLIMLVVYELGVLFISVSSKLRTQASEVRTALGFGDVLLGGVIGLMVAWPDIVHALFLSILLAGGFGLLYIAMLLIARRYHFGVAIPYVPFLIAGAIYALFIR